MTSRQGLVVRGLFSLYPLLVFWACHQSSTDPRVGLLMLFLAMLLPFWLLVRWLASATETRQSFLIWLTLLLVGLGFCLFWWRDALLDLAAYYRIPFLIQDVSAFAFLAYVFGATLYGEREPLCTFFARHVHGNLSAALLHYTRRLTLAWSAFFVLCGVISLVLYVLASATTWALVSNIVMPILTLVFFVLETQFRRFAVPPEDYCGLLDTFKAFSENSPIGKKIAGR